MRGRIAASGWRMAALVPLFVVSCVQARGPSAPPAVVLPPRGPAPDSAPPPTRAVRALPPEGTIEGGAGALWYQIVGAGPDTVIVPLGVWLEPALAPLGTRHTVVFYDPRHRGRSHELTDSAAATFDGDVADLDSIRKAVGASRVAVIGYDYYAAVAAAWAAVHPQSVTRLVLLSPIEPSDSLSRSWEPLERLARLDTVAARALVKDRAAGRDTSDAVRYCEDFWRINAPVLVGDTARLGSVRATWCELPNEAPPRIAVAAGGAIASLGPGVDFGARAGGLSVPTLVMHGRLDLVANPEGAREWARRISGARLLWLSNVGHLPQLEAGPEVVAAINDFLAGGWPPRAGPP